jgi:hypothetical protein
MNRLVASILAGGMCLLIAGCGESANSSPSPAFRPIATTASTPTTRPMPPEYRVLAKSLGMDMKPSLDLFRDDESLSQIIAEGHSAVMDLRGIRSSYQQISISPMRRRQRSRRQSDALSGSVSFRSPQVPRASSSSPSSTDSSATPTTATRWERTPTRSRRRSPSRPRR